MMQAAEDQSGGNMEGKETRFGIASSAAWAEFTTAASNGSVNSAHDSYTPLSLLVMMVNMQLGEIIFGGVGCGLYGMLCFAILTVFIAGLMVGRTPEYLGKKIEPYEMKMAVLVCLVPPVAILAGSGIAALLPGTPASLGSSGVHGFSELLYAFTSCGANNGSAMAGLSADTPFFNGILGLIMLVTRFVPMAAILLIAAHLADKRRVAVTEGTLRTDTLLFAGLLVGVILLVGAHAAAGEVSGLVSDISKMADDDFKLTSVERYSEAPLWAEMASASGLIFEYARQKHLPTGSPMPTGEEIFAAYNAGEPEAQKALKIFARRVAVGILSLQNVLDVEKVAIGGGISAAEALLPAIQAELDWLFERCTVMPTVKPELVRCRYGNDANLIGALKLFFEQNPA